jgi:GT2 family glycosyltransferase
MLAVLIVHFGSAQATRDALAAVLPQLASADRVFVLDNAGDLPSALAADGCDRDARVLQIGTGGNAGFAGGMNQLLAQALAVPGVGRILLLNNDAVLAAGSLAVMLDALDAGPGADLVAARLMRMHQPDRIDSLGITLYRSGIASNRTSTAQRLLGPTGGCLLAGRRVFEDLRDSHGEIFDEAFFCYAEDTDLAMRARWLGYGCVLADQAVVLHHGSLSSGGPDSEFVLYHGIRNSIWALAKNAPATWLLAFSPWLLVAHGGVVLRNLRKGRWRTVGRLYRDALVGLPAMWRKRGRIRAARRVPGRAWWSWVEPRLYDPAFLRAAWRELFGPRQR